MLFNRTIKRLLQLRHSIKSDNGKLKSPKEELLQIFRKSALFSSLTKIQCNNLLNLSEEIILKKGDILFQKGDISDSLYIVVKGQLIASAQSHLTNTNVGNIYVGETVGELGIFSQKVRSLTVRALHDTNLLKVSRTSLIQFWELYSSAELQMRMIDEVITRSQSVIKILADGKLLKHGIIISATNESIPAHFIEQLKENLSDKHNLNFVEDELFLENNVVNKENIKHFIEQSDKQNKTIIFIIKNPEMFESYLNQYVHDDSESILNNIDAVYLFAPANTQPFIHPEIRKLLDGSLFPFITKKELLLFHPESVSNNLEHTSNWLDLYPFTLHHHIRLEIQKDFQRLLRFFSDKPVALVFSGGGIRSIAALGVIKALEEENIPIDAIGGTSAGSLIASVYALHQNFEDSYQALSKYFDVGYKTFKIKNLTYPIVSINNGRVLNEPLYNLFSDARAENLSLPNFSIATNLTTGEELFQNQGLIWENLRCSMSLPLIYPPVIKNGDIIVDGGLLNNMPVDRMKTIVGNKAFIIGVILSGNSLYDTKYNFPSIIPFSTALFTRLNIANKEFKYPPLIETFINSLLAGSTAKTRINSNATNLLIQPDLSNLPILGLKPEKVVELVERGYLATKEALNNMSEEDKKKIASLL